MPRSQMFLRKRGQKCLYLYQVAQNRLIFLLRWHDAIRTLAKLHNVDPASVDLTGFGKPSGFYNRQIRTLGAISVAQSQVVDIETNEAVGKIPFFEEMISFFIDKRFQPEDRGTLVHGDYKIDNLVYHKTEPKVIGILE